MEAGLTGVVQPGITRLKELLATGCRIEKVQPPVFASDAEVNVVIVSLVCPDGDRHTVRAYREEAHAIREFVSSLKT
ncbi:MAG: hypothetical protein MN733_15145 [Nitrososphaera sp.]|nr:hypothetical protein [Nitrososphaera sp.]